MAESYDKEAAVALINCPECSKQVSSQAPSCPNCGAPIASAVDIERAGTALTTVQETSKRLKVHILISAFLFWGGLIGVLATTGGDASSQPAAYSPLLSLAAMGGLGWYIVTKVRIWWHHK